MKRLSAGDIVQEGQSYYSLVVGVAKRAREIAELAEDNGEILVEKPVQIAVEQLAKGDYKILDKENLGRELE